MIIPKHLFADYIGGKSRDAPNNLKPVGTGPYLFVDFKPGDIVRAKLNPDYHLPNRPYFDTIEIKGGGDAVSAARAVLQTGEYDYAWNMQVEDEILQQAGELPAKARSSSSRPAISSSSCSTSTDPATEVDGERSSIKTKHPLFSDPAVRQAINLLIDRASIEKFIYGRTAIATANFLNTPEKLPLEEHQIRVQHREGQRDPRGRRLEKGRRRHSGQGRQVAEVRVPDLDQRAAAEDPSHHQAGLPEGGHRCRAEIGGGIGVLLLRYRQPRHLPAFLLRRADVHHHHDAARSGDLHEPVRVLAGGDQGEQVAGAQHLALAKQGI